MTHVAEAASLVLLVAVLLAVPAPAAAPATATSTLTVPQGGGDDTGPPPANKQTTQQLSTHLLGNLVASPVTDYRSKERNQEARTDAHGQSHNPGAANAVVQGAQTAPSPLEFKHRCYFYAGGEVRCDGVPPADSAPWTYPRIGFGLGVSLGHTDSRSARNQRHNLGATPGQKMSAWIACKLFSDDHNTCLGRQAAPDEPLVLFLRVAAYFLWEQAGPGSVDLQSTTENIGISANNYNDDWFIGCNIAWDPATVQCYQPQGGEGVPLVDITFTAVPNMTRKSGKTGGLQMPAQLAPGNPSRNYPVWDFTCSVKEKGYFCREANETSAATQILFAKLDIDININAIVPGSTAPSVGDIKRKMAAEH